MRSISGPTARGSFKRARKSTALAWQKHDTYGLSNLAAPFSSTVPFSTTVIAVWNARASPISKRTNNASEHSSTAAMSGSTLRGSLRPHKARAALLRTPKSESLRAAIHSSIPNCSESTWKAASRTFDAECVRNVLRTPEGSASPILVTIVAANRYAALPLHIGTVDSSLTRTLIPSIGSAVTIFCNGSKKPSLREGAVSWSTRSEASANGSTARRSPISPRA